MRGEALLLALGAGMASGFLMGMVFIGVGAAMLPELSRHPPWWLRLFLQATALRAIALPLAGLSFLLWGLVGVTMGALYHWLTLYISSVAFSLGVITAMALATLLLFLTQRRLVWERAILNLAFAGIFSGLLPLLAG